jgi:hypothetical protein
MSIGKRILSRREICEAAAVRKEMDDVQDEISKWVKENTWSCKGCGCGNINQETTCCYCDKKRK